MASSSRVRASLIALMLAMAGSALSACNTIEGIGQDVERGGEAVSDTARDTKQKM